MDVEDYLADTCPEGWDCKGGDCEGAADTSGDWGSWPNTTCVLTGTDQHYAFADAEAACKNDANCTGVVNFGSRETYPGDYHLCTSPLKDWATGTADTTRPALTHGG